MTPRTADELRAAFTGFFTERGHVAVPSASLIPHDPTVLFSVAGMVPFKPYFTGDEAAPYKRAVTVQKCARAGGKHNDLDDVGRTKRHLVFFEMLGNFSFGDYFKSDAIPWSWELVTNVFGLDGDRLWITVHHSDDEAEQIWHDQVGVPMNRIQRLGDKDNFWQMGETGPCGPCSEIHIDRGEAFGPPGGPLNDPQGDRFMEFWNLVFMQFNQAPDGTRTPLPKPSIDTGAGLERILTLAQGVDSVWETDVMAPLIEHASGITGQKYQVGNYDDRASFSLRVLAEHARSATMLVSDGVYPSNENRGYVLRRIIRRAVRHAYLLGTESLVMPLLAGTAIDVMEGAYSELSASRDLIVDILTREEEKFRQTLRTGLTILEKDLAEVTPGQPLGGSTAFMLHDTYGFPLELTAEITGERGVEIDVDGFNVEMAEQRRRAKDARKQGVVDDQLVDRYRAIVEKSGVTEFVGYSSDTTEALVLDVIDTGGHIEVLLERTPFYAESGGQVGDTGTITTPTGVARVVDTTFALPGLRRHVVHMETGSMVPGQTAVAVIDVERRNMIRRNHTGTHVLHWALRRVLGEHVQQAGSLVAPDRLRFDFNHFAPVTAEQISEIELLANTEVLTNSPARAYETTKDEAMAAGATAFFGDKYGDIVRVLEAGSSIELCGGTHVRATGDIGTIKILSEGSIGSNLRRLEAVTGTNTVALLQRVDRDITRAAQLLGVPADSMVDGVERKLDEIKALRDEIKQLRAANATGQAAELAASAVGGVVVARVDGLSTGEIKDLAVAVRQHGGVRAVVLAGITDTGGVSLAGVVTADSGLQASQLIANAAKAVGGGGGGKGDIATAGGKNPAGIDDALRLAREAAGLS